MVLILVFLFFAVSVFAYEEPRSLKLPAEEISLLDIDSGAGFLNIKGIEGLTAIEVEADIVVKGMSTRKAKSFIRKKLVLTLEKKGSRAYLVSKFKPHVSLFSWGTRAINLTVHIPSTMPLKIDDGSGSMTIESTGGDLNIKDGSGEAVLENIRGNIIMDDGSGDLTFRDVVGDVQVDDGSGDITAESIEGGLFIDDSSGSIRLEDIRGKVNIDDSSGSIRVRNALGDVVISDGSGSIRVDRVEKDVIIKRDGSGGVTITNVKGRVVK